MPSQPVSFQNMFNRQKVLDLYWIYVNLSRFYMEQSPPHLAYSCLQHHPVSQPSQHILECLYSLSWGCVCKLQIPSTGLQYPSSTAVFSYTLGSRKLLANEHFLVSAQTVTTKIISDVCFITDHAAYASSNKTKIVWIETELRVDESHVYVRAWALGCFRSFISTQTFRKALTVSADSCMEILSAPWVA